MQLPPGSTVLYAELVWGGLFRSTINNISALTDNAVTFTLPSGAIQVSPDVITRQNFNITNNGVNVGFYVRSANVTTQVRAAGTNTSACRQGWDITAVDVSALPEPGMTTAVARFTTAGDLYVPNCLAMQIDSLGARLEVVKSADKSFAQIGEEVRYTLTISNEGSISADNVSVTELHFEDRKHRYVGEDQYDVLRPDPDGHFLHGRKRKDKRYVLSGI